MTRLPVLCSLLLLAGGQARSQPSGSGQPVLEVTTDSRAYCRTLARQIEAYRALPRDVRDLQAQGCMLCDEGHVRGGINRLRRALMALHSDGNPTPARP